MMKRPVTTLFLLQSVDGKINSGNNDALDVDRDWKNIPGLREGLQQYYDIEQETDLFSLNTGRVMAKIGVNERTNSPKKMDEMNFVIIDNAPHLNECGIDYLVRWVGRLILVTTNSKHPAFSLREKYDSLHILYYDTLNLQRILEDLREKYGAERVTIQSGGELNCAFLRADLIDYVNIVVAPVLVGGRDTPTMIDGEAISSPEQLAALRPMKLTECKKLNDSYVQLCYEVIHRDE